MNAVVVDTDVVSYLFKGHPTAFEYLPDLKDRTPIVSFMTIAELDRWSLEAKWAEVRRQKVREYLERFVSDLSYFLTIGNFVPPGLVSRWQLRLAGAESNAPTPGLRPRPSCTTLR
jgi:hypothetical protein